MRQNQHELSQTEQNLTMFWNEGTVEMVKSDAKLSTLSNTKNRDTICISVRKPENRWGWRETDRVSLQHADFQLILKTWQNLQVKYLVSIWKCGIQN